MNLKAWRGIFKLMEKAVTVPESMSSIDNVIMNLYLRVIKMLPTN